MFKNSEKSNVIKKKKMSTINCLHYLSKNIGQNFKFSYIFINHCK